MASLLSSAASPNSSRKFVRRILKTVLSLGTFGLLMSVTACSPVVPMNAAQDAQSVECANVQVRLPDKIDELKKRVTNAQSTAAYGDPEAVLIRCGIEMPVVSDT